MNNESSTLCNLNLEESDLRKLQELDPFQTDGYQSHGKVHLPVRIVYTNQKGKETSESQMLTLQILTRWLKPAPSKGKQAKGQPLLDSARVCLFSQEDIFLNMVSNMSNSTFEALKTKNQLNLHFKDFPNSLLGMLKNCTQNAGQGKNQAELRLSFQGTGKMVILQQTEYKVIELIELYFSGSSLQKAHQSIIYRYNFNKTKLSMIQNSIDSIYKLLAVKNAPLLAYIQKTVGDSF